MQFKLEEALEKEEYEKAAFYRDYLKVLNGEAYASDSQKQDVSFDTEADDEEKKDEKK